MNLNDKVKVEILRRDCIKIMSALDDFGEEKLADIFSEKIYGKGGSIRIRKLMRQKMKRRCYKHIRKESNCWHCLSE